MCGRFVEFSGIERLKELFPIDEANCETAANYNVAPSQEILAIANVDGSNVLDTYHWGLVPFWAKDKSIGNRMINARCETVAKKPAFREAFQKRRCLIPADGFYEWKGAKGQKQPVYITLPHGSPLAFAGLWETWRDANNPGEVLKSCAIITRESVGPVREIHHRMPVILPPSVYDLWLDTSNDDTEALGRILADKSITDLILYPVGKQVNSVKNNAPSNLEPVQTGL